MLLLEMTRAVRMALNRNAKSNASVVLSISLKVVLMSNMQYGLPIGRPIQTRKPNLRMYRIRLYVQLSIRQGKLFGLSPPHLLKRLLLDLATRLICRFILILNRIMRTLLPHPLLQTILSEIVGLQIRVQIPMSAII